MADGFVKIGHKELEAFAQRLLEGAGVASHRAALVASNLIFGNLRGVDSHGMQLLPYYVDQLSSGLIDGGSDGQIVQESGGTMLYGACNGLGAVTSDICCGHAVRLAKQHGIAFVVARDANHFGAAAYWGRRISREGLLGFAFCNASPIVPPFQAKEPRLGTNPICLSVPGPPQSSWLLDMATTTVAANRIFKAYHNKQQDIPPGWAMDKEGRPTTSTEEAFHGLIMPLGGYKGTGLAVMVEILCAVLGGGAMSTEVGGLRVKDRPMAVSHSFLAIDPARFVGAAEFDARMEKLTDYLHSAAPGAGFDEVLIAGEPEARKEEERTREGVPLGPGEWQRLVEWAERFGVALPVMS
ncbi:MAG TPA: Ldh family oxidoreductase [Bryobacteraceae bacterium]|nr:Ldh family oxidoreductase [Bryobacteraceae bacterium]